MQFLVEPVGKVTAQVTRETACPPDKAGRMQGERLGFATKSTPRRHRVSAQAAHRFYASCAPCQPVQVRKVRGFASKARVLAKLLDCLVKLQVAPLPTCQNLTFRRISPSWPAKVPSRVERPSGRFWGGAGAVPDAGICPSCLQIAYKQTQKRKSQPL